MLTDLREAVGGEDGKDIMRNHAAHLVKETPEFDASEIIVSKTKSAGLRFVLLV